MPDLLEFTVLGLPVPKGSLKCVGRRGHHLIVNDDVATIVWQTLVTKAATATWGLEPPMLGPVAVEVVLTLTRPRSVKPADRPWPSLKSPHHGDIDKLARTVLDALTGVVVKDDAQVVELTATKVYPDTPHLDRLTEPGAVVRVIPVTD
jgi:hypothetical protein